MMAASETTETEAQRAPRDAGRAADPLDAGAGLEARGARGRGGPRLPESVDVLVVGAGPSGCAAALAFSRRGAKVALVDANPDAARRFAGEWMHPPAVRALRGLGVDTGALATAEGHGFVLYGGDGRAPVELPYLRGTSIARLHHQLVEELRGLAAAAPGVTYLPNHAFSGLLGGWEHGGGATALIEDRAAGRERRVSAGLVLGADGRSSRVAECLEGGPRSSPLSYMLGVELRDVRLPFEGLGHVIFGGPGPALLYRVDERTVRGCLDVPVALGAEARKRDAVLAAFSPVLPAELRAPFAEALSRGAPWAATRFQPRVHFGRGSVWLAGDAVGHVHPISGMGMTFGILDAVAAAEAEDLASYRRAREVYVSELLTNVLYLVFHRQDPSAERVRRALLEMLRRHPSERRRTMQVLTSESDDATEFARSFLRASGYALADGLSSAARDDSPGPRAAVRLAEALLADFAWLKWPLSAMVDDVVGSAYFRPHSTIDSPLPGARELLSRGAAGARRALWVPSTLDELSARWTRRGRAHLGEEPA